jgi:Protein of unknown function (DUF2846)
MRIIVLAMLLTVSAFAQTSPAAATAACGPENVTFNVKLDESQHALSQPEPGKALIYFIQEKGSDTFAVTTGIGLDGAWAGANKNSSYFAVSAEPGEHHVCASMRSFRGHAIGLAHFTAEAGSVYYFSARVTYGEEAKPYFFLGAADSDQAKYQIASFPLSISNPMK